jgi:fructose-1,6-bisphosphatase I
MEIRPTDLHERCPLFIGSTELVEKAEEFLAQQEPAPAPLPTH